MKKLLASGFPILLLIFFLGASLVGYGGLAWYVERDRPEQLALCFLLVFSGYAYWWFNRSLLSWRTILITAILFRVLFVFDDSCRLSDDVFRFIWDAEQVAMGQNPYEFKPTEWAENHPYTQFDQLQPLYQSLNSKEYYSVYPPTCQLTWGNSVWISNMLGYENNIGARIIVLKSIYIIIEIITMLLLVKILLKRGQAAQLAGIYALNPLVIIEFSGNLHPEAIMILFLVVAAVLALSQRFLLSAIPFGFAVATKFLPILFIPFLIKKYGWKQTILFSIIGLGVAALLFLPFVSNHLLGNITDSLGLYFHTFEFNASTYFIVRNIVHSLTGFNYITYIGPALMGLSALIIAVLWWRQKSTTQSFLWVYVVYILLATTVHPWYLAITLVLAIFTTRRWPMVASCAVMLSYFLYTFGKETWWLIGVEYFLIITTMIFDYWYSKKHIENMQ
jgi:hypothetical protein